MLLTGRLSMMALTDIHERSQPKLLTIQITLYLHHDRAQIIVGTLVVFPDHHRVFCSYMLSEHSTTLVV